MAAASAAGVDVMEVDTQSTPSPPATGSDAKLFSKKSKGKGKGRAATQETMREEVDDDVVMSDSVAVETNREKAEGDLDMVGLLDRVPREPVYAVCMPPLTASAQGGDAGSVSWDQQPMSPLLKAFAALLRSLAVTEWLAGVLTLLTRWANSREGRSSSGSAQQQASSSWGKILLSGEGRRVLERLMKLHRHVLMEVSRGLSSLKRICNIPFSRVKCYVVLWKAGG